MARVRPHLADFGITRVADITGLDHIGLPVFNAIRPNARSLAVSQGKGATPAAAWVSAAMEAIELHVAEHAELALLLGGARELARRHRVVDAARLPRLADSPWHERLDLLWVGGRDLATGEPVLVPREVVTADWRYLELPGRWSFQATTNGLASGNTTDEAVLHALCEVVERDAETLWRIRGGEALEATRLDLDSVDDPLCRRALDAFAHADVAVAVWETTSDVGVATFSCLIADRSRRGLDWLYTARGSGCHPRRAVALLRALTEAAQSRLGLISGARDDLTRELYDRVGNAAEIARMQELAAGRGDRPLAAAPDADRPGFAEDVAAVLEQLRTVGLEEAIAVDFPPPSAPVRVVRVVVPGLEDMTSMHTRLEHVPGERAEAALRQAVSA